MRRRDWQKEQTRLDLAFAAFELAQAEGLANVRVPQIAEAVRGVDPDVQQLLRQQGGGDRVADHPAGRPAGHRP